LATCDFANTTNNEVIAYSDAIGGDISMNPDPNTGCSFSSGAVSYYGAYQASQTVTASLAMGTYTPHYKFDVYFNLILVDRDDGGKRWDSSVDLDVTLLNTTDSSKNQRIRKELKVTGGSGESAIVTTSNECGGNKEDKHYRLVYKSYNHYDTGSPIDVTFKFSGNGDNGAVWNIRDIIFVVYNCNSACLSCTDNTNTSCYSCNAGLGYMLSDKTCHTSCLQGYGRSSDVAVCLLCSTLCTACEYAANNCTACKSTAFLFYNVSLYYYQCVISC
jgi:hypothetical protein